jgi:small subunit ribosomal protein S1
LKVGDEVEAIILTLDRDERKMSLGIKQLKSDPWENIEERYPVGSTHVSKVRNFTNFGVFVEIEEGVDGLIHISDLSWTKKIKHPSEFTQIGSEIEVVVLDIDKDNRRLSLGHKQLEENPWDALESVFYVDSIHDGVVVELLDKGAVIALPYGVEGFASAKQLVKEDGTQAQVDEKLPFKVIEFNKDAKKIVLSHTRIHEDLKRAAKAESVEGEVPSSPKKSVTKRTKKEESSPVQTQAIEKTTFGDIQSLVDLKDQMENEATEKLAKKETKSKKATAEPTEKEEPAEVKMAEETKVEEPSEKPAEKKENTEKPLKSNKKEKSEKAEEKVTDAEETIASEEVETSEKPTE